MSNETKKPLPPRPETQPTDAPRHLRVRTGVKAGLGPDNVQK